MTDKKPLYQVARRLGLDENLLAETLIKHDGPIEYFGRDLRGDAEEIADFLEEEGLLSEDEDDNEDAHDGRSEKRRAKTGRRK